MLRESQIQFIIAIYLTYYSDKEIFDSLEQEDLKEIEYDMSIATEAFKQVATLN